MEAELRRVAGMLSEKTRAWIGETLDLLALQHDISCPPVRAVNPDSYSRAVTGEIRNLLIAAEMAGEVKLPSEHLDIICAIAAREVRLMREIRHAHEVGDLNVHTMCQLPMYSGHQNYFDENSTLVMKALEDEISRRAESRCPPSRADPPASGDSGPLNVDGLPPATVDWLRQTAMHFAFVEDLEEPPVDRPLREYVEESLPRLLDHVTYALRSGTLHGLSGSVESTCRWIAAEALELRRLRQDRIRGAISRGRLRRNPRFPIYRSYFEPGEDAIDTFLGVLTLGRQLDAARARKSN
jgi:hypothetical protein